MQQTCQGQSATTCEHRAKRSMKRHGNRYHLRGARSCPTRPQSHTCANKLRNIASSCAKRLHEPCNCCANGRARRRHLRTNHDIAYNTPMKQRARAATSYSDFQLHRPCPRRSAPNKRGPEQDLSGSGESGVRQGRSLELKTPLTPTSATARSCRWTSEDYPCDFSSRAASEGEVGRTLRVD